MASRTSQLVSKTLYQISIAAMVGVVVWVGFSVYQALTVVPKIEVDAQILKPITANLDLKALESVANRQQLSTNIDIVFGEITSASSSPNQSIDLDQ